MRQSLYLVVGLGKTGLSIARYLRFKNKQFIVFDTRADAPFLAEFQAEFPQVPVYLNEFPEEIIKQLTDVIASPGIALELPIIQKAIKAGADVYGDVECLAREINTPVVAITGTNGKTTVTTLVGEMAAVAGHKVAVAGNIGAPVLDLLLDENQYDLWVLELSSFQLDLTYALEPSVATILNVSPDHLDRHHTMQDYVKAKQRIYHHAKVALYNNEDEATKPQTQYQSKLQSISFGKKAAQGTHWGFVEQEGKLYLAKGKECLFPVDALLIKGVHNWLNALAAAALADCVGISAEAIVSVLKTFSGLPHRCQWVRTLDGVDWINDSKGTNIGATLSAINGIGDSMQGKIVLIAGGQGKGADFTELRQPVGDFVRSIILIGEDADKLQAALADTVPLTRAATLDSAVLMAKAQAKPGDVVLLSPACASLDMFRDFNHRGEQFAALVNGL